MNANLTQVGKEAKIHSTAVSDLLVHGISHDSKIAINQINQKIEENRWRLLQPTSYSKTNHVLSRKYMCIICENAKVPGPL